MQKQTVLTREGLEKLQKELETLKGSKRREVAEKIKVALGYGDLSENSEYDEAKNEQAILEARIADLEVMLKDVKVIDEDELTNEHVHIGSTVKVSVHNQAGDEGRPMQLKIVGSSEADPLMGCISDESAVGSALLGREPGELVSVEVPAGTKLYEVVEILK